ncbi:hypothetical protein GCM10010106_33310 [Thermopolyspora flexuosa]|jgi:small-conductance mechanosensitive channel|uniref:Uncharacterized protein n=1 Tax=Thermopolyspora flexuosa TaxID=103836 RepID=A0A543IT85_9ACTN|nr:hypothetical protein [Thermopolyspora flexuosa]TQM73773.1 hypothetical protein FHX40_0426 [Thermopolyspora flexuosa]GGM83987.1 hypothetical protein GCM10010106_33310 [Thermopolyspora flexuosa]
MNISPEEAARALEEVERTRRRTLRNAPPLFPSWYLVAIWAGVAVVQFSTEVLTGPVAWAGVLLTAAGYAAFMVKFFRDVSRWPMRPHRSLIDPMVWVAFGAWLVGGIVAGYALIAAFSAAGLAYPRTTASCCLLLVVAVTAPLLPRWMATRNARTAERRREGAAAPAPDDR